MRQTDWHVLDIFSLASCGLLNTGSQTHFQVIAALIYIDGRQVAATSADPVKFGFRKLYFAGEHTDETRSLAPYSVKIWRYYLQRGEIRQKLKICKLDEIW